MIRKRTIRCSAAAFLCVCLLAVSGCGAQEDDWNASSARTEAAETKTEDSTASLAVPETAQSAETTEAVPETEPMLTGLSEPEYPVVSSVRLMAVGDNLMHLSNSLAGRQPDGNFDFTYHFQFVAPIIQQADIAVINQECVMGGEQLGIQTYPCFNTVFDVGRSIVNAGFNVVLGANNHILDQGAVGVHNMIDYWKINYPNVQLLGIHENWEDYDRIRVVEKNGIKIAMLNYTYGTNVNDAAAQEPYIVDYLNTDKIKADVERAKAISDFIIVFPHWGEEYNDTPTPEIQALAAEMASWGVDMIIGAHPHVVEPVNWVPRAGDKPALVYYSLGNFQSEQFKTVHMLGGLADVTIVKDEGGDTYVLNHDMQYLVTHYQLTVQDLGYYNVMTTYPWEQYTPELAAQHGIVSKDPTFSYEKLAQIRQNMIARCQ